VEAIASGRQKLLKVKSMSKDPAAASNHPLGVFFRAFRVEGVAVAVDSLVVKPSREGGSDDVFPQGKIRLIVGVSRRYQFTAYEFSSSSEAWGGTQSLLSRNVM